MKNGLTVEFGIMAPPLKDQFPGLKNASLFQRKADAIAFLYTTGLLTEAETFYARRRFMKSLDQGAGQRAAAGKEKDRT